MEELKLGVSEITKASCQAWLKLLIANEVRMGGLGGGPAETDKFEANHHLILVATVVVFQADAPGGNWVTVGFDSPLVHPWTCIGGEGQNIRKAMEEPESFEKIGVR